LGSANETEYWLMLLKHSCSNLSEKIDKIIGLNLETIKMLASTLKSLRTKR